MMHTPKNLLILVLVCAGTLFALSQWGMTQETGSPRVVLPPAAFQVMETQTIPTKPVDHTPTFLQTHASSARANASRCTSCHQTRECVNCHTGALRPLSIHPPGFVSFHAIDARTSPQKCQPCHTTQTFCRDCHNLSLAGTTPGAAPPPGLQFHPQGWVGSRGNGSLHGPEAKRNLTKCASCHQEEDCVRCHTKINPHPSNFAQTCSAMLNRNARTCVRCHADLSRLKTLCL